MSDYLERLKELTRWNSIPNGSGGYRLLCSNPQCSLSCANLRGGRLSVTSMHGNERHSYLMSPTDMAFVTVEFLNSLSEKELQNFVNIFNKTSPEFVFNLDKL
jgi:hypothetical protein